MSDVFEKVHTMTDYYDGPRRGIADFEGRPHVYLSDWDDGLDEHAKRYRVSPIDAATFALALEDWGIWLRWEAAFHEGRATLDTHPCLPEERQRHDELARLLDGRLNINDSTSILATGEFEPDPDATGWDGKGWRPLRVQWTRV